VRQHRPIEKTGFLLNTGNPEVCGRCGCTGSRLERMRVSKRLVVVAPCIRRSALVQSIRIRGEVSWAGKATGEVCIAAIPWALP
jgi:hypothetical protein